MALYRLYYLDGSHHPMDAVDAIEASSDDQACQIASQKRPDVPRELWLDAELIAEFPPIGPFSDPWRATDTLRTYH